MFNHVLAALLGITAIILDIVTVVRFDLLSAYAYDRSTSKKKRDKSVRDFLDDLDDSREERYSHDRSRMLRQFDGFRSEWDSYCNENADNFELYYSRSIYA